MLHRVNKIRQVRRQAVHLKEKSFPKTHPDSREVVRFSGKTQVAVAEKPPVPTLTVSLKERQQASAMAATARKRETRPAHHKQAETAATPSTSHASRVPVGAVRERDQRYVDLFLGNLTGRAAQATINHYKGAALQFLAFTAEHGLPLIPRLKSQHIDMWTALLARGDPEHDPPLRAYPGTTIRNRFLGVRAFFKFLYEAEHLDRDLTARLKLPKMEESQKDVVSEADYGRMLDHLEKRRRWRDLAILLMFYDTGMRVSELANLRTEQLDEMAWEAGVLKLYPGVGSKGTAKTVQLDLGTRKAIKRYWQENRRKDTTYVFNGLTGHGQLKREGVYHIVRSCFEEIGVPNIGPHDLKHTKFTHAIGRLPDSQMKLLAGWAPGPSGDSMMQRYTKTRAALEAVLAAQKAGLGSDGLRRRAKGG